MGHPLFERSAQGVALTPFGEAVIGLIEDAAAAADRVAAASRKGKAVPVHLAIGASALVPRSLIEELRRASTLVVIAHKLETISAADQVVVLGDDGRVAQVGRHCRLVEVDGPYRDFWTQRTRARGWALV